MSARFFLDTNIFAYTFDPGAIAKANRASELIQDGINSHKGTISFQVVQEFFHLAFRRFSPHMTLPEAERYLATIFQPLLAIHSSAALYGEALRVHSAFRFAWYDSLIVAAALQGRCDVLYTEDLTHGQSVGNLRIVNPFL